MWILILAIALLAVAVIYFLSTQQPSTSGNFSPIMYGNKTLYDFSLGSICTTLNIAAYCPSLKIYEPLDQAIPLTLSVDRSILVPGESLRISSELGSSSQSVDLILVGS